MSEFNHVGALNGLLTADLGWPGNEISHAFRIYLMTCSVCFMEDSWGNIF